MGLDVALGVVILIAAIRGWLQGFTYQFIRLAGLVACVYLADPVRDQVKPYVASYLPAIEPTLLDRLLWWVAASVTYIVLVGTATLALNMTRRPEIPGMPLQRSRNDQFAGLLLGAAKGAVIAVFLLTGLEKYGSKQIEAIPWAQEQTKSSQAIVWNGQYHPAARIWDSVPVTHFVDHIWRMGLQGSSDASPSDATEKGEDRPVAQTARRIPAEGSSRAARRLEAEANPPAPPALPSGVKPSDREGDSPAGTLKSGSDGEPRTN
jgi:uncharacterized membrane protein required for colicin V production